MGCNSSLVYASSPYASKDFMEIAITFKQIETVKMMWDMILADETPTFREKKAQGDFKYNKCSTWFYNVFSRKLSTEQVLAWKDATVSGEHLCRMISICIHELWCMYSKNPSNSSQSIIILVKERGYSETEFSSFSDILISSLKEVCGIKAMSSTAEAGWKGLYAAVLRGMVINGLTNGTMTKEGLIQDERLVTSYNNTIINLGDLDDD